MVNFTFNLLDRFGVLERVYTHLSNAVNKHVLKRHTLNTELISDVFKSVDGFWLKYGNSKSYSESEIRIIIGSVAESLRDNSLSSGEVRTLVNYITALWNPEIAKSRMTLDSSVLLPSGVEDNALRSVDIYNQMDVADMSVSEFVALSSKAISENLPDNKITRGITSALNLVK